MRTIITALFLILFSQSAGAALHIPRDNCEYLNWLINELIDSNRTIRNQMAMQVGELQNESILFLERNAISLNNYSTTYVNMCK